MHIFLMMRRFVGSRWQVRSSISSRTRSPAFSFSPAYISVEGSFVYIASLSALSDPSRISIKVSPPPLLFSLPSLLKQLFPNNTPSFCPTSNARFQAAPTALQHFNAYLTFHYSQQSITSTLIQDVFPYRLQGRRAVACEHLCRQ